MLTQKLKSKTKKSMSTMNHETPSNGSWNTRNNLEPARTLYRLKCPLHPGRTSAPCQQGYSALAPMVHSSKSYSDTGATLALVTFYNEAFRDSVLMAVLDDRKVRSEAREGSDVIETVEVPTNSPQRVKAIKWYQRKGKLFVAYEAGYLEI
jgi:hypothetical protein